MGGTAENVLAWRSPDSRAVVPGSWPGSPSSGMRSGRAG